MEAHTDADAFMYSIAGRDGSVPGWRDGGQQGWLSNCRTGWSAFGLTCGLDGAGVSIGSSGVDSLLYRFLRYRTDLREYFS